METVEVKKLKEIYPDEWILLGNPQKTEDELSYFSGVPLFHSKDKRELGYLGRDKTHGYSKIAVIYTGTIKSLPRKITSIFRRVEN